MLRKILVALLVIIVVLVGVIAMQPSQFRVARATTIAAPAPVVFTQVNDFHKWEAWNPWGKLDPAAKQAYEGAPAGAGASYSWSGNSQVGEGRMTIVESRPSDLIRIKLEFFKPMAGTSEAAFTFKPEGDRTAVTWTMTGTNNFVGKAMCLIVNMDRMIGGQFEKGLADMKAIAEAAPKS
jgi:Polyketide cyclase / dehydrase and lipid transport